MVIAAVFSAVRSEAASGTDDVRAELDWIGGCSVRSVSMRRHHGAHLCCGFRAVAAEIGFRDGWIAPHFGGRAFGDLAAEIQHVNAVGDVHHDPHLVLDHQYGDAEFVADIEHEAGDVLGLLLVHARHHFVEQQQFRFAGERPRQLDALLLAVGQRADDGVADVLDLEEFDDVLDPLPGLDFLAAGAAEEDHGIEHVGAQMGVPAGQDVLDDGAVLEQCEVLEGPPDPDGGKPRRRYGREIGAVEHDAAAAWPQHARRSC